MNESPLEAAQAYVGDRARATLWSLLARRLGGSEPERGRSFAVAYAGDGPRSPGWAAHDEMDDPWDPPGPALDALVAIGALSEAEAEEWARRLDEARPQPFDEGLRAVARRELASARDTYRAVDGLARDRAADTGIDLAIALEHADLIDVDEAEGLFDEIEDERPEERDPDLVSLERVIAGPPEETDGFRLLLVEIYDDGFVLRSQTIHDRRHRFDEWGVMRDPWLGPPRVRDDLGNVYEVSSGGGHGFPVTHDTSIYGRPLDPRASRLFVERGAAKVEVVLR